MRLSIIYIIIFFTVISGCTVQKEIITANQLSNEKVFFVGLIEYDYSNLEYKSINGLDVFIESDVEYSEIDLPKKYLPKEKLKKHQFICAAGNIGNYELRFKHKTKYTPESDKLLSLMDINRNLDLNKEEILHKYFLNDKKIINIGKLVVTYEKGNIENGNIIYSYSFKNILNDTTAINAFKLVFPIIYDSYQNEIYEFRDKLNAYID